MYHYKTCGLDGIYLRNGYTEKSTPYGDAFAINNIEGLHRAIGLHIAVGPEKLSGKEFRFLRKEMDFTQKSLADILDYDRQTIIKWENESDAVPTIIGVIVKKMYQERMNGATTELGQMLGEIAELDRQLHDMRHSEFEEMPGGDWVEVEALAA